MRAPIVSAGGLNLQALVGAVGTEGAWVITDNAAGSIEPGQRPDVVIAVCGPGQPAANRVGVPGSPGSWQFANFDVALRAG